MKALKFGLTLFSMVFFVAFSSAQNDKSRMTKEELRNEKIIEYVGLSAEKADKAREISRKYTAMYKEAATEEEKAEVYKKADAEAKSFLTEEQYKKYKQFLANEKKSTEARNVRKERAQEAN